MPGNYYGKNWAGSHEIYFNLRIQNVIILLALYFLID